MSRMAQEAHTLRRAVYAGIFRRGIYGRAQGSIVEQFHKLYYDSSLFGGTWRDTRFMGVPIVKCPLDLWVYQEMLHELKPDVIVECGTCHGGSALYLASMCDLIGHGRVVTIDIEERPNRPEHPRIKYLMGSSVSPEIVREVESETRGAETVLVILDSDHSRDHVLAEMRTYWPLVSVGSYMIVEDSNVNGHPVDALHGPGPMEAIDCFLEENDQFEVDAEREKFYLTFNPRGYLRRLR